MSDDRGSRIGEILSSGSFRLALGLALALTVAAVIWRRTGGDSSDSLAGRPVPRVEQIVPGAEASGMRADLELAPEMVERAQLQYGNVTMQPIAALLRTTATVQPDAYRETPVLPLVEGRLTSVNVRLGDTVSEGQVLATIFSAELAETQMKYLTVDANLQFHINQARRFEKLADIGAVSRQELEEVVSRLREHHAEHSSLKERMRLYGLTDQEILALQTSNQVRSDVPVHAPTGGTITTRDVNVGQNLAMRDRLFTITDLSNVWVIASIHEKDIAIARTGTPVSISTLAYPDRTWSGKISYVDPRVDPATRTLQVRVETPNHGLRLKPGMFVDAMIRSGGNEPALVVPRAAVQEIGQSDHQQQVVFVPLGNGRFSARRVILGEESGGLVRVIEGLKENERIVTEGSFFLKAEMAR